MGAVHKKSIIHNKILPTCIIGVWPCVEYRHVELLKNAQGRLAGMIGSVVEEHDCIMSPAWPLLVQLLHQLSEEELDDLAVAVGLGQREVDIPLGVQAGDHGDPGLDLQHSK